MVWDMLKNQDHKMEFLKSDKSLKKFPFNEQLLQLCTECWQRYDELTGKLNAKQKEENGIEEEIEGHMLDLKLQVIIRVLAEMLAEGLSPGSGKNQ
jgi:hypothetical protein